MRILKTFIGMSGVVAFLAVCLFASSSLSSFAQTDPIIGTWKLNLAKSKFSPGPPLQSLTLTYEAVGQGLKVTAKITDAEGKIHISNVDTIALKRIDAHTVEFTRKKAGKVVVTGTNVVSKDGKTLTITAKGNNPKGVKFNNTAVFEKQ